MIGELEALPAPHKHDRIDWNEHKEMFLTNYNRKESEAIISPIHDILEYGNCVSRMSTFMWHVLGTLLPIVRSRSAPNMNEEWLPFFKRLELKDDKWVEQFYPSNMGGSRDIPRGAVFHPSVIARFNDANSKYRPMNQGFQILK